MVPRCTDIQLDKDTTMAGHYTSVGVRHWRRLQRCTRWSQKPLIAARLHAPTLFSVLHRALMLHSKTRKTSCCDAVIFRERPLDIVSLTVLKGTHTTLEKQEANSGEVSSQHLVGFFKDECTNLLSRRVAGWLDWMGRDELERQRAESQWIVAARPLCHLKYPVASKGSLGHTFTVCIRTGNQNQTSFYPSVPHKISVLVELILGHLRYLLTDVPPHPNSPPDNVFHLDRPAKRALGPKRGAVPHFRFTE
ncbi:Regulator of rDNA transcription protein 15 [Capsicum baccatum]|uniref:Regulator of rDNA transcription protein 15 n=1 Tax=Capsicum baccatum TaxID=33114 RepID=A0A2G2UZC9_CAPBA|nr:Regulator of rDNA transcription protein 15 [Capsicum baccatum]